MKSSLSRDPCGNSDFLSLSGPWEWWCVHLHHYRSEMSCTDIDAGDKPRGASW